MVDIVEGQCFSYQFGEERKNYFFTGIVEDGRMIMCEMVPPSELTPTSLWKMSERFFKQSQEEGKLQLM